jgi:hypothetical protein
MPVDEAAVDVPQSMVQSNLPIVASGLFDVPGPFHQRMLEVLGLRRNNTLIFGAASEAFTLQDQTANER